MTKFLYAATIAIVALYGYAAFAQEASEAKAPSATAICGYKWRQAKAADPSLKGREAWGKFRTEQCGQKSKTRNDDAIKQYLDSHPAKVELEDENEDRPVIVLAKFKKGGK